MARAPSRAAWHNLLRTNRLLYLPHWAPHVTSSRHHLVTRMSRRVKVQAVHVSTYYCTAPSDRTCLLMPMMLISHSFDNNGPYHIPLCWLRTARLRTHHSYITSNIIIIIITHHSYYYHYHYHILSLLHITRTIIIIIIIIIIIMLIVIIITHHLYYYHDCTTA